MAQQQSLAKNRTRDMLISLFIYTLPVLAVYLYFKLKGEAPWLHNTHTPQTVDLPGFFHFIEPVFKNLQTWGFLVIAFVLGIAEFALGLYDNKWTKSERAIDIVCFVAPKVLLVPVTAFFSLQALPWLLPGLKNEFSWVTVSSESSCSFNTP